MKAVFITSAAALLVSMSISVNASEMPVHQGRSSAACASAFHSSSASATCRLMNAGFNGTYCSITAECERSNHWNVGVNTFTGTIDQVYRLVNCDGTMKVGGC